MSKSAELIEVIYEHAALPDWGILSPWVEIPLSTPVCVAVRWQNTGTERLNARVYLKVTDPSGQEVWINPDLYYADLDPGEETWIYFDNIIFATEGNYSLDISLVEYGETMPLDAITIPIGASYVYIPPDGGTLPSETFSVIGFAVAIGMVGAMVGITAKAGKEI
jgi:hypothetical protein